MVDENTAYAYLGALPEYDPNEDGIVVPADFNTLHMGHPNVVELADGTIASRDKFSSEGFPTQNLSEVYIIPLYVNGNRRMMYKESFKNQSVPPDCQSNDGITPLVPLTWQGRQITDCMTCPLFGYSKEFKCRNNGALIGLAYFPDVNESFVVPIRKNIPAGSIKPFNNMLKSLVQPVPINGAPKKLPYWTRIIKCTITYWESKDYGKIPGWGFEVLTEQSIKSEKMPTFVPPHLIDEIQKMVGLAKQYGRASDSAIKAIGTAPAPAQLTGATAAGPDTAIHVMAAEEAAEY